MDWERVGLVGLCAACVLAGFLLVAWAWCAAKKWFDDIGRAIGGG